MRCPQCSEEVSAGAKFCHGCGTRLGVVCPGCNHSNVPGGRYCSECGRALAGATPPGERFASPRAYTPDYLAEKILGSRPGPEGERKQVTVLFADVKASTEMLADRDPEEARALLDPVLDRMMEAVHRFEGTVNQVLGDGVMALFGAPLGHEDHAIRACYAALRMQQTVTRYGEETRTSHGVPIRIRVGLNSGEVVVRSVGHDLHTDYTAVGQTTHLAARMEQMARPGSILITAETFHAAEEAIQAQPMGPVPVKGLGAPVPVYELTGVRAARAGLRARSTRSLSPFVGREAEAEQLRHALEQARAGHGQVVAVVGEPGVGKTRLFTEFTRSPHVEGWFLLESSSVSYGRGTPYRPVIELMKAYFQIEDRDATQPVRDKVTDKMLALDERLTEAIPPILSLLDVLRHDDPFRALGPRERRGRAPEALKRLLFRESRRQPLLLVFENLHWIDSETQAFLDSLVESLPTARILLLVSYRPEYQHGWGAKTYYTQLPIEPLPPETARVLLRQLLGDDAGLQGVTQLLIERTDGNPFFLEESVQRLVETGALVGAPGAYRLAGPLHAVQVPATVQTVLAARIDRLPPEDKQLLQSAAVIGKDFAAGHLQAIAGLPDEALRRGLAHLQAAELIYETSLFPDLEYTFKHALTHEVAYGSLLHERRRALHAQVVNAIETLAAGRLADQVERLAHHAFRGELWEKAVSYLRQAAARAAGRAANAEAVTCLEQALAALARLPETRETLGEAVDMRFDLRPALLQLGRLADVLAVARDAEALARRLDDEPRLVRIYADLSNYHYLKGEPERALEYGERCLEIGRAGDDLAIQALARRYMGQSFHAQGRYPLAAAVLAQNVAALEAAADAGEASSPGLSYVASCGWLAFTHAELGDFESARRHAERAQQAARRSRHPYGQAIAWTLAGLVAARQGYLEEARGPLEQSVEACREKHLVLWQPIPSSLLGLTLAQLGRVEEGLPLLEDAVALGEKLGIAAYLALWTAQLAEGLLAAGDTARAREAAARALELARAHGEAGHQAWAHQALGDVSARLGEAGASDAIDHYRRALALARELGMRPLLARCHLGLGRAHRRIGGRAEAEHHLSAATALLCPMDMRLWIESLCDEMKALGHLFVVGHDNRQLYDYLARLAAGGAEDRVILDRRRGERRRPGRAGDARERRVAERRRSAPEGRPTPDGILIAGL
jgi:predicted ATPase/class 3 adenylate cyclase